MVLDDACFARLQQFGVCERCTVLFIDPKNEPLLLGQTDMLLRYINNKYPSSGYTVNANVICPCCLGCLTDSTLASLVTHIATTMQATYATEESFGLNILIPPVLDIARMTARAVVYAAPQKQSGFPNFKELLQRILTSGLKDHLRLAELSAASIRIDVEALLGEQADYARCIMPSFVVSRKRKLIGEVSSDKEKYDFNQKDSDRIIAHLKQLTTPELLDELEQRLTSYLVENSCSRKVTWKSTSERQPIYLLGRYRKLARDVSQAPWTVPSPSDSNEADQPQQLEDTNESDEKDVRVSVEAIVSEAVCNVLGASRCRMHPCGREDIDVRMLGNGRPFIVEVIAATMPCTDNLLRDIESHIAADKGLNAMHDVEVVYLQLSSNAVWVKMQAIAEEKKKGYQCVIWSEVALTKEMLRDMERRINSGNTTDAQGETCLEITQATPLRVLHRRSMLQRARYIYSIDTVLLNPHFFLLRLVTSAGTYVKEFVHGDLGRTMPNIGALLGGQADILQLDVVQLFDEFDAHDDHMENLEDGCSRSGLPSMSLELLKAMKIPKLVKRLPGVSSRKDLTEHDR